MAKLQVLDLIELRFHVVSCSACTCRPEAISPVPGSGELEAGVMVVGRNPGREEDKAGVPFVGPGGKCLRQTLEYNVIDPDLLWITNTVKCYTKQDRPPTEEEYRICTSRFLWREMWLLKPEVVVLLGNDAFHAVFSDKLDSCTRYRKTWLRHSKFHWADFVTIVHPGYAVRSPEGREMFEEDWAWLTAEPIFEEAYRKTELKLGLT